MQLRHPTSTNSDDTLEAPIVVSLGKAKRKQIKRLKKGRGPLMEEIQLTVEEFQKDQSAAGRDVVPLVFIVREKKRKSTRWMS